MIANLQIYGFFFLGGLALCTSFGCFVKELGFLIRSDVTSSELWVARPAGGEDLVFLLEVPCV